MTEQQRFWLDSEGRGFDREPVDRGRDVWDQYGPATSRYVYPVVDGIPYAYAQRSLPWVENPAAYHQYEVIGDVTDVRAAYERSTDPGVRQDIDDLVAIGYYAWDRRIWVGTVAPAFGDPGGASMLTLPLPVGYYVRLGLLRELDLGSGVQS